MDQEFDLGDSGSDQEDFLDSDSYLPFKGYSGNPGISIREAMDKKENAEPDQLVVAAGITSAND